MGETMISYVIRCYNEEKHVGRLLEGICQQKTSLKQQTILVDSGSEDATLSIASRYPVEVVHIKPGEFSFGRALNKGIDKADGEYIIIASAHVYPLYRDWAENLVKHFENQECALVYGKQRGNQKTRYSEHMIFRKWFPDEGQPVQKNPFCNNANSAIRRRLWENNPYDEKLTGLEDLEWAKQVMEEGYHITYAPDAEVVHVHDETYSQIKNRYMREAIALKKITQQQFGLRDFIRLYSTNTLNDVKAAFNEGVLKENLADIMLFRYMQFLGTYKGFRTHGKIERKLKNTFYYPPDSKKKSQRQDSKREKIQYTQEHENN